MCSNCERCYLSIANLRVPGREGGWSPAPAPCLMFIGDVPTISDYKTQTLFNGRSTKLLSKYIDDYSLTYWTIKRTLIRCVCAEPNEYYADKCYPNIVADINRFNPIIIVAVGQFVYRFLKEDKTINMANVVNKVMRFNNAIFIPIYSPTYVIRNQCYSEYVKSFGLISDIFAELCKSYKYYRIKY